MYYLILNTVIYKLEDIDGAIFKLHTDIDCSVPVC